MGQLSPSMSRFDCHLAREGGVLRQRMNLLVEEGLGEVFLASISCDAAMLRSSGLLLSAPSAWPGKFSDSEESSFVNWGFASLMSTLRCNWAPTPGHES